MDRERYIAGEPTDYVEPFANERLIIAGGQRSESSAIVSLQATFIDSEQITIENIHVYHKHWRDQASYAGLLLIAMYWLFRLGVEFRQRRTQLKAK